MRGSRSLFIATLAIGSSAFAVTTLSPVWAQERPESLLPPGFEEPAKRPDPAQSSGGSQSSGQTGGQSSGQTGGQGTTQGNGSRPTTSSGGGQASGGTPVFVPGTGDVPDVELTMPIPGGSRPAADRDVAEDNAQSVADQETDDPDAELAGLTPAIFDVPSAAARSLEAVGLINGIESGFSEITFGAQNGAYVHGLMAKIQSPMVSRWATITGRRLMASLLKTPDGMSGQQFVADRAWILLKMGEANLARALVQQVDASKVTEPLTASPCPSIWRLAIRRGHAPCCKAAWRRPKRRIGK